MSLMLCGVGVSRGVAIGKVRLLHDIQAHVTARSIPPTHVKSELRRFELAVARAVKELTAIKKKLSGELLGDLATALDSHIMMLEDKALLRAVTHLIQEQLVTSEWALALHSDEIFEHFEIVDDPYLAHRKFDIEEIIGRILNQLADRPGRRKKITRKSGNYLLVAGDIAPAELLLHAQEGMRGLVTVRGSPLSHTTIVARSLGVPAISGVENALSILREDETLIIDGDEGAAIVAPERSVLKEYREVRRVANAHRKMLGTLRDKPAVTVDRVSVRLMANIETPSDAAPALRAGAEGIGLYRTEAMFLNREDLPSEDEQYRAYRKVVKNMHGAPVTIRTMDVWASNRMPGVAEKISPTADAALGLRAIRLCLRHPELFTPQLRAILRAAVHGPVSILIPMVTNVDEIKAVNGLIEQAQFALKKEGTPCAANITLGLMIEVPAAAISCGLFAPHVDFFAIGSNDLAQYTLAMNRDDDSLEQLFDPLHPAVLRLIYEILRTARRFDLPVTLCGEMAGDPRLTRLLLGLGLRQFSMNTGSIPEIKSIIMNADTRSLRAPARRLFKIDDQSRVTKLIDRINAQ